VKKTATTIRKEMSPIEIRLNEIGQKIADENGSELISTSVNISDFREFSGLNTSGNLVPIIAFQICVEATIKNS
jgi:hypothetical protein